MCCFMYNKRRHPFLSILSPQKYRYILKVPYTVVSSYLVNAYMPGKKHVKIYSLVKKLLYSREKFKVEQGRVNGNKYTYVSCILYK